MKRRWMRILPTCALAIASRHGLRAQSPDERVKNLVVMIDGKLGGSSTQGAGILFGLGQDRLYIATANHVVRRGADQASELKVQLKWLPGEPQQATLLTTADPNLDLAVLAVTGLNKLGISNGTVPFDLLGDATSLKRGDAAHTLGYPSGRAWDMPVSEDRVANAAGGSIQFESAFLYPGNSGGALLNGKYELIGLVRKDEPPNGEAASIDNVTERLKAWGYTVSLRRRAPSAPADSTNVSPQRGGSQGSPTFTGTWLQTDPPKGTPPMRLKISQTGNQFSASISYTNVFSPRADGQGTVDGGKAVWREPQGCGPRFQTSGYDYTNPGVNIFTMQLSGSVLVYTQETDWTSPCGGHPIGKETVVKHLQRSE